MRPSASPRIVTMQQTPQPEAGPARPARRWVFPVFGGVLVGVAAVVGLLWSAFSSWADSVCNDTPAVVRAHTHSLRVTDLLTWMVVAAVPALCAAFAAKQQRRVWPWLTLTGGFLLLALATAAFDKPQTWCLY